MRVNSTVKWGEFGGEVKCQEKRTIENKHELILSHRDTAVKLASNLFRKWGFRIDREEIISLSDLALCEAAERYSGRGNSKFTTYLYYYIKGEAIKAIERARALNATSDGLTVNDEIEGKHLSSTSRESAWGEPVPTPEEVATIRELRSRCQKVLVLLTPLERTVILQVIINGNKVAAVARTLGYSRGHLSDVKRYALNTMKSEMEDLRKAA